MTHRILCKHGTLPSRVCKESSRRAASRAGPTTTTAATTTTSTTTTTTATDDMAATTPPCPPSPRRTTTTALLLQLVFYMPNSDTTSRHPCKRRTGWKGCGLATWRSGLFLKREPFMSPHVGNGSLSSLRELRRKPPGLCRRERKWKRHCSLDRVMFALLFQQLNKSRLLFPFLASLGSQIVGL